MFYFKRNRIGNMKKLIDSKPTELQEDYKHLFPQYEDWKETHDWIQEGDLFLEFSLLEDIPSQTSDNSGIYL